MRANVDLREQVVSFPPQPVITSDNLVVSIDTVIYFQVTDAKSAVYEIANYIQGIEQLTVTTLRNVIGSLDLEQTLTSRDQINGQLRGVLDEATGQWGIRVNRVELKAIDPPHSVQDSMEKQMRAERDRRATILTAEGVKQSHDPHRRGREAVARSCGPRAPRRPRSSRRRASPGPSCRCSTRSTAATRTRSCWPTSTCRCCRRSPRGDSNKIWIIPSELTDALKGIGGALGSERPGRERRGDGAWVDAGTPARRRSTTPSLQDPVQALAEARGEAAGASAEAEGAAGVRAEAPARSGRRATPVRPTDRSTRRRGRRPPRRRRGRRRPVHDATWTARAS